ncbi:hypothetical protein [Nocardia goodfellowii]|uniref:Uncharacterized protein n=1 Tax=Nocardia goodfellowii TaxID=882446 RepID=A0ABS4QRQ7_9NOCA|nr:hypothetical protein [Nocardia goodfellowii]MBP2194403.1 hypothetical protein [Nocardia goodfellowii]
MFSSASEFHSVPSAPEQRARSPLRALLRIWFEGNDIRERRMPFAGYEPVHPRGRDN